MSSAMVTGHRIEYVRPGGERAVGVVWCPGPGSRTLWVLPESGARAADAFVVKLAERVKGGGFDGDHHQVGGWERPPSHVGTPERRRIEPSNWNYERVNRLDAHFAPKLPEADWRAVVGPVKQLALMVEDAA